MNEMTNDELIIEIARLHGMTIRNVTENDCELLTTDEPVMSWEFEKDAMGCWIKCALPMRWATDIAAAWELEGEIPPAEVERYVLELTRIINAKEDFSTSQRWQLIHATPRERCLAYLAWKAAK